LFICNTRAASYTFEMPLHSTLLNTRLIGVINYLDVDYLSRTRNCN